MTLIIRTTGFDDYLGTEGAYIKALIMGPPGAGKTRSASFWQKPIFADCEKGRMSIADRGVPYGEIRSGQQMDDLLDLLKKECKKGAQRKYQTLVIDTIDSYQRIIISERLISENKEALSGWADWGHLDAKMSQFLEKLLNLPMNVVVNMHVKEKSEDVPGEEDSKLIIVQPKLKGDLRYQIAAEFDLVGYMSTYWAAVDGERALKRSIRWFPEPRYPILKDRSGQLPRYTDVTFTDEDFNGLYNAIVGDHIEALPQATVIGEIGEPEPVPASPVGPDEKGGAVVADVKDFPRSKADKKDKPPPEPPAPPVKAPVEVDEQKTDAKPEEAVSAAPSPPDTSTAVAQADEPEMNQVTSESKPVDKPKEEALICGTQPARLVGKSEPAPGCTKPLQDKNRGNITVLRTSTYLCDECFQMWKDAN